MGNDSPFGHAFWCPWPLQAQCSNSHPNQRAQGHSAALGVTSPPTAKALEAGSRGLGFVTPPMEYAFQCPWPSAVTPTPIRGPWGILSHWESWEKLRDSIRGSMQCYPGLGLLPWEGITCLMKLKLQLQMMADVESKRKRE